MEYSATIKGRVTGDEYCLYCANEKATPGKNSFATLYPVLLKDFSKDNDFNPDYVFSSSKKKAMWDCHKYGLQWRASIYDVVKGNRFCPFCSGEKVVPGATSLKALYTEIVIDYLESNTISSDEISPNSTQYVFWNCKIHNKKFGATVKGIVEGAEKCPYCSGKKVVPGENSFKALYPEIAMRLDDEYIDPDHIFPTYSKSVSWKCHDCGLRYKATVKGIIEGTEECSYCSGKKVIPGKTSLKALFPDMISSEWKYVSNAMLADPDKIFSSSSQHFFWTCRNCRNTYHASPISKTRNYERNIESCPYCKGLRQKYTHY